MTRGLLIDRALTAAIPLALSVAAWRSQAFTFIEAAEAQLVAAISPSVRDSARADISPSRVARSPFRLSGILPVRRLGEPPVEEVLEPPPAATFQIAVQGIVGGPPWQALLVGLPEGHGNRVARVGDRFGPVWVLAITDAQVELATADTLWSVRLVGRQP